MAFFARPVFILSHNRYELEIGMIFGHLLEFIKKRHRLGFIIRIKEREFIGFTLFKTPAQHTHKRRYAYAKGNESNRLIAIFRKHKRAGDFADSHRLTYLG